jgi:hypothetical protein
MTSLFVPSSLPPVDEKEVLRYAGVKDPDAGTLALLRECEALAANAPEPKVCWARVPVAFPEEGVDLGFAKTPSQGLRRALEGCRTAAVFCATVGMGFDRLIAKNRFSPSRVLFLQAIGAERAEALCDLFCDSLHALGDPAPRFSPGYGDLPLSFQIPVFALLAPQKTLGVTLGATLLMTPAKSVTAIAGIREKQS